MKQYNANFSALFLYCVTLMAHIAVLATPVPMDTSKKTASKTLDKAISDIRKKYNIAAAVYVIVSPENIVHSAALGVIDKNTPHPATLDTVFRIGSITKSFTSLALLKLEEQGLISLQDTLTSIVKDAPLMNPWQKTNPVLIAHLLEHTAGLSDFTRKEFDYAGSAPLTLEQGLFFTDQPRKALWPPGLHSSYSNAGAGYAAYALEKVTGKLYEEYVKETLFTPLNMKQASFYLDKATQKQLATGYDTDGSSVIPYWNMILRPFGAINTTPREMAHFVQMLLNYGHYNNKTIFYKSTIQRMEIPETTLAAQSGLKFGYGTGNYQYVHNGFIFHGHGGDADGYLAHYAYNRDINRGYFMVINAFNYKALHNMRDKIEDYLTLHHKPPEPAKTIILPIASLEKLTGNYLEFTQRFAWDRGENIKASQLNIRLKKNTLQLKLAGKPVQSLLPTSKYHFRFSDEPMASIAFVYHEGKLYLQTKAGNYQRIQKIVSQTAAP